MTVRRAPRSVAEAAQPPSHEPTPRLFTVDEYYKMAEVGILRPDERVQLIEGVIVQMPPIGPRHAYNVDRVSDLFRTRLVGNVRIRSQQPIRLAPRMEPEPDLALVRSYPDAPRTYESRHPEPRDILFVVEIADSTLSFDLGDKARSYAQHRIVELWVLDLQGDRVVVHRDPTENGYASVSILERGESVVPSAFPDVTFTVDEILG